MVVQDAGAAPSAVVDQELFRAVGAGEAADGIAGQPEFGGNLAQGAALGQAPVHVGVAGAGPVRDRPRPQDCGCRGRLRRCRGGGRGDGLYCGRQVGAVAADVRSTASPRLCHRWQRSATWTAPDAPRVAPSE